MSEKLRVGADFDGFFTDVTAGATRYQEVYEDLLAQASGAQVYEIAGFMHITREEIQKNAGFYGWENNGVIVAPASADPYIETTTAAQLVVGILGLSVDAHTLQRIHTEAYKEVDTIFREDAQAVMEYLRHKTDLTVITNSATKEVREKIALLMGKDNQINVVGDAKKYHVDPKWQLVGMPTTLQPEGFPRPVYLQRPNYDGVLSKLGIEVMMGDVYELDLALPEAKGKQTILLVSDRTPAWEKAHYQDHPTGTTIFSLSEIPGKLAA